MFFRKRKAYKNLLRELSSALEYNQFLGVGDHEVPFKLSPVFNIYCSSFPLPERLKSILKEVLEEAPKCNGERRPRNCTPGQVKSLCKTAATMVKEILI